MSSPNTAVSSENENAAVKAPSGLDTIVMALQALQKEPTHNANKEEASNNLPTASETFPPIPNGKNSTQRVVSTDSISESDTYSSPLEKITQGEGGETASSEKSSGSTFVEAGGEPKEESNSSSTSLPQGEPATDDGLDSKEDNAKAADFSHILADPEGWLKQTENMFAKLPPVDMTCEKEIVVQPNDVLCGRGGETNHHPGNIRYRSLVKAYQKLYLLAKRRDKPKIAQCIVVSVRGVDGRFLRRTKNAIKGNVWVDVGNVKAREKTSQALREGAPNLRENVNPALTTSASNDATAATDTRQMLAPEQAQSLVVPPTASPPTLPTSAPTALQSMMGWKASSPPVPPIASSPSHGSMSPTATPSDADNEAYMKIFTQSAAQLMQHPLFHQLDQAQQYEAILFECKNARAAVEAAKRNATGTGTAASTEQDRSSPTTTAQQPHRHPYAAHEHPYYNHGQSQYYVPQTQGSYWPDGNANNPKIPSSMDLKPEQALSLLASKFTSAQADNENVDLQRMYRELLAAKAAASAGASSSLASGDKNDGEASSTDEEQRMAKKRPISSPSTSSHSITSPVAVVSDIGSDTSSSSSSFESAVKEETADAPTTAARGGSRLKRFKLRMKNDFD